MTKLVIQAGALYGVFFAVIEKIIKEEQYHMKERNTLPIGSEPIPAAGLLNQIIDLKFGVPIHRLLEKTLLTPISDMVRRPSKRFRSELVHLGCRFTSRQPELNADERHWCMHFSDMIELLHAGSLIIDDIEDQSSVRRGQPTIHLIYGLPAAINAGNWLYFWPLMSVAAMRLPEEKELWVQRYCHYMLMKLHCGQALDLGARMDEIPQEDVFGICLSSMELKSGSLMTFALSLGSIAAELPIEPLPELDELGYGLGIALQMFDDLGNLLGKKEPEKRYEDLIDRRPCWVWAFAAKSHPMKVYQRFVDSIKLLPDDRPLQEWLGEYDLVANARKEALNYLEKVYQKFETSLGAECRNKATALDQLRLLGQQLSVSYF